MCNVYTYLVLVSFILTVWCFFRIADIESDMSYVFNVEYNILFYRILTETSTNINLFLWI